MKKKVFTGSGVAIVTPFTDNGIDYEVLGKLIDIQIENQTDAIIICGTTGEASTMPDHEHKAAIAFAVKHVGGRVPVIAGTGSNDTPHCIELSKYAESVGVDALLLVTPYYNKTTQKGLVEHYTMVANSVKCPIILYNVPSRTALNITPATYLELSKVPNIVAVKEASPDISQTLETAYLCGDNLHIYSGNDEMVLPTLSLGGIGVISVAANIVPKQMHDMVISYLEGDREKAMKLQIGMAELIKALFIEVNPIPVKTAMSLMGYNVGKLRMPLTTMVENNLEILKNAMIKYGLNI